MSQELEEKYIWKVLEAYFRDNSIVKAQLDSFNDFVQFGIQRIVDQESTITVNIKKGQVYTVKFGEITIAPPQVIEEDRDLHYSYPADARRRNLTYDSAIYCDLTETFHNEGEKTTTFSPKQVIGRLPVMLGSSICNLSKLSASKRIEAGECPNDPGGYFIISGYERTIVASIRGNYNQVIVLKKDNGHVAEVRSMSNETGHSVLIKAMINSSGRPIEFSLPCIEKPIPAGIVFKALGYTNMSDIVKLIDIEHPNAKKLMNYIERDSYFCQTQKEALEFIGKYAMHTIPSERETAYAKQVVETELFPHLGITGTNKEQACFLAHLLHKLLATHLGLRSVDDRDNYANKRIEVAGVLLAEIFRNLFKKYIIFIKTQLEKRKQCPDVKTVTSRIKSITKGIHQCMSTGNWSVQKNASYVKAGVSQILDRMTYLSSISHLRRIIMHIAKEGKNVAIRQLHASQYGYICPSETPEGHRVGVVLNFALLATVSNNIPAIMIRNAIDECKNISFIEDIELTQVCGKTRVMLNSVIIGYSEEPHEFIVEFKELRTRRIIPSEVSITYDLVDNDIKIYCDEGRVIRPLFTLTDNKLNITAQEEYNWRTLLNENKIQYVDASEIENSVIAMTPKMLTKQYNDFCEIHPVCMLGVIAMCTPFSDHSQSPRNTYQASMGKQAIGVPSLGYNIRTDTMLHVLHYAQKPLVTTKTSDILGINDMPSGLVAIVAIMPMYGYNQEDSIILNQGAIDRGLFHLTTYRTISECEKKRDTYSYEKIGLPPRNSDGIKEGQPGYFKRKNGNYSLLDENGIVKTRTHTGSAISVKKGDVIIGKMIITGNKAGEETCVDASKIIQVGEEGIIDRVHVNITPNGYKLVKVVIRKMKVPTLGDKLASRSAQKGTIVMIYPEVDMPFTVKDSIRPDIIINPLCVVGDTQITINDRKTTTIDKLSEDVVIKTVQPDTCIEEQTNIYNKFKKKSSDIVRVSTWSGRTILCTSDHPFLVGPNTWVKASELKPNKHTLMIVHSPITQSEVGEIPNIDFTHNIYKLSDFTLNEKKLQIIARLLGSLETDGHIHIRNNQTKPDKMVFRLIFYLGELQDVIDISEDIELLGFKRPSYRRVTTQINGKPYCTTYRVEGAPGLGYVLYKLGAHVGRKSACNKIFPSWLLKSSPETQRQFLSGFQGGDGSYIAVNEKTVQQQVRIKPTKLTSQIQVLDSHLAYMKCVKQLFDTFHIECSIHTYTTKTTSKEVVLYISVKNENLERYADIINYAYCNEKRRKSRLSIEFLRLRNRGIRLPFSKMKEYKYGDAIMSYVDKIEHISTEYDVYDFTTKSETHSFIANSIVVHNCIPSRMTINQLIECALGKMCLITGEAGDATPFTETSVNVADGIVKKMKREITRYGFKAEGTERMINGMTGEMIDANIFIGPTYYQRLKHMVDDKLHARARGHVTTMTRQPLEGVGQPLYYWSVIIKLNLNIWFLIIIIKWN